MALLKVARSMTLVLVVGPTAPSDYSLFFYLKLKLVTNSRDLRREKGKVKMKKILVAIFVAATATVIPKNINTLLTTIDNVK
jgi:hypothetical protein